MGPKLPFDSRDRDEPESDPPRSEYAGRDRHAMLSDVERIATRIVNAAIAAAYRPVKASLDRIETEAIASRIEREARKLREQQEREEREQRLSEAIREKTQSESNLFKAQAEALQRPATPLLAFPPPVVQAPQPREPESDAPPSTRPQKYNKTHIAIAIIGLVSAVSVAAIGACNSQHAAPHGYVAPTPVDPAAHH